MRDIISTPFKVILWILQSMDLAMQKQILPWWWWCNQGLVNCLEIVLFYQNAYLFHTFFSPTASDFRHDDFRNDCFRRDNFKLPTPALPKETNWLKVYARKLGVNDRGCYLACALGGLAFFFFTIIIAMGASWPGKWTKTFQRFDVNA